MPDGQPDARSIGVACLLELRIKHGGQLRSQTQNNCCNFPSGKPCCTPSPDAPQCAYRGRGCWTRPRPACLFRQFPVGALTLADRVPHSTSSDSIPRAFRIISAASSASLQSIARSRTLVIIRLTLSWPLGKQIGGGRVESAPLTQAWPMVRFDAAR
jgi:hypothetical protein